MINEIQRVIEDMYANKRDKAYKDFQEIVPKIQMICSRYLEEYNTEESITKVRNFIRKMLKEYECMDIVSLADTLQYDLVYDIFYHKSIESYHDVRSVDDYFKNNIQALKKRGIDFKPNEHEYGSCSFERSFVSNVSTKEAAYMWAKNVDNILDYDVFFIFGLSDGSHVRELMKKINETNHVIVYEPSIKNFYSIIKEYDMADVLGDKNFELYIDGINDADIWISIKINISYNNRNAVKFYVLPNYDVSFTYLMERYLDSIMNQIRLCVMTKNLMIVEMSKLKINKRNNTFDRIKEYHVSQLKKTFEKIALENVPAILVSAGPSLDKNIEELRLVNNKAFIIVVDTAMKTMINHNIDFHMGATVDPQKPTNLFDKKEILHIPMLVNTDANNDVIMKLKGKRFYSDVNGDFLLEYVEDKNKKSGLNINEYLPVYLQTGGSVANNVFSFLIYLGFKTIILIGQDLAFTDEKSHTDGAYATEEENRKKAETSATTCYVKDVNGVELKTDLQMFTYIKWFEAEINKHKGMIDVIDATEGGAFIEGTKVMTLKEAINKYCNSDVDFSCMINKIETAYKDEDIQYLNNNLHNLGKDMQEIELLIKNNIKYCEDYLKGKADINIILTKIKKSDYNLSCKPLFNLIVRYSQKVEYDINENVFAQDEDSIDVILNKYITLYEGYLEAIKEILDDWSFYE